jgi:arsenate reductase (thioredoxin)
MFSELDKYIQNRESEFADIPESRKSQLREVAVYIKELTKSGKDVELNFICTHNSRRSHLSQIWSGTAAGYYGLNGIHTYSGGTEATAFNPRAVAAIERAGFSVENPGGDNPEYKVRADDHSEPMICFSKKFGDPFNPQDDFAAVMTCSDADENCPFVPGATKRFSITYIDPKESDGTPRESETYDDRCRQIAREMLFMMKTASD